MSRAWLPVIVTTLLVVGSAPGLRARADDPPSLAVADIRDGRVTLTWQPVAGGPNADLYLVEGGLRPGQTLASLPVAGTASSLTLSLAPGTYYARLYAIRGGLRSGPSNEVLIGMGVDLPPSAPRDVQVLAIGNDVALSWRPSFEGGVATDTVLDVSGPITGSLPLQSTGDVSFGGVPDGVYTLTLRARNAAGVSAAAAPMVLTVPGPTIQAERTPAGTPNGPRLPVRYENYATPRLAEFVARERLAAVVAGAPSEFEAMLRLKDWVAAQFPMGTPSPYPPWDALVILDWIRAGYTGGFCGQYSQVFLQALAAFGIPARYLEIGTTDNPFAHFTTEVWSNDFNKWVLLDVTVNSHFERDGIPMSALDLREALFDDTMHQVDVVLGTVRDGHPSPYDWPKRTAELFYYMRYHLNANHLSAPGEPVFDRYGDMVEWLDGRAVPWELSTVPSVFPHVPPTAAVTGDRRLVEWAPNQIWIAPRRTGVMQFTLDLQHSVLRPSHVEYRVRDAAGDAGAWRTSTAATVVWQVGARDRTLELRGVNDKGIPGPISSVKVVQP